MMLSLIENSEYSCGHPLIPTNHPLEGIVLQRLALNCEDPVEKEYYNPSKGRDSFVTDIVCAVCCSDKEVMNQQQIEDLNISNGFQCLPFCKDCHLAGFSPPKSGKRARQNNLKAAREVDAKKAAAAKNKKQSRKKRKTSKETATETKSNGNAKNGSADGNTADGAVDCATDGGAEGDNVTDSSSPNAPKKAFVEGRRRGGKKQSSSKS